MPADYRFSETTNLFFRDKLNDTDFPREPLNHLLAMFQLQFDSSSLEIRLPFYTKSLSPLPRLPISQTSHTRHALPLYLEWYFDPSNAHSSKESPL